MATNGSSCEELVIVSEQSPRGVECSSAELAAYTCDRRTWGRGAWDDEPDFIEFKHAGFPCRILRNDLGTLCGYVGVSNRHFAFGKDRQTLRRFIVAHGDINWTTKSLDGKLWWLGFDCSHEWDLVPASVGLLAYMAEVLPQRTDAFKVQYRNVAYVRTHCISVARQLKILSTRLCKKRCKRAAYKARRDVRRLCDSHTRWGNLKELALYQRWLEDL